MLILEGDFMDDNKDFEVENINGSFYKKFALKDKKGKILKHVTVPLMVNLRPRDILQIIIGASILAIPVGLTEECWILGEVLPIINVMLLLVITIIFIAGFIYFNYYRFILREHLGEYLKRVLATYIFSFAVVAIFLTLIDKCPWSTEPVIALKRILIATFPCSMSATVSDILK